MIIVLKPSATEEQITKFTNMLKESYDVKVNKWDGVQSTVLGLIGDTTKIDIEYIDAQDIVENVKRVQEPYKKANRKFHPDDTVIKINDNVTIGDGSLHIMAGPCSVESEEQIVQIAKDVKASGATLLRGGAFKPRTSPYAFQGLKAEGLDLLKTARRETGLPIVTEIMRASHIDMFENVDIIQVGARNMQNFELLKELGKIDKPILLKRGLSATIEEWLMSAEYIMAGGNDKVMLCERGIRTYETFTRNTLDISAIPIIKSFLTFLLLLIRAMLRASHGLLNRLQWQQLPQVQTVLLLRFTTIRRTHFRMVRSHLLQSSLTELQRRFSA